MYSANGRLKQNKETAKTKVVKIKAVCLDCKFEEEDGHKTFGEVFKCAKCGSENVVFDMGNK